MEYAVYKQYAKEHNLPYIGYCKDMLEESIREYCKKNNLEYDVEMSGSVEQIIPVKNAHKTLEKRCLNLQELTDLAEDMNHIMDLSPKINTSDDATVEYLTETIQELFDELTDSDFVDGIKQFTTESCIALYMLGYDVPACRLPDSVRSLVHKRATTSVTALAEKGLDTAKKIMNNEMQKKLAYKKVRQITDELCRVFEHDEQKLAEFLSDVRNVRLSGEKLKQKIQEIQEKK